MVLTSLLTLTSTREISDKLFSSHYVYTLLTVTFCTNAPAGPNVELMYRLEKHSGSELPAFYWWRLHARELEQLLRTDLEKKLEEAEKVKNSIKFRA